VASSRRISVAAAPPMKKNSVIERVQHRDALVVVRAQPRAQRVAVGQVAGGPASPQRGFRPSLASRSALALVMALRLMYSMIASRSSSPIWPAYEGMMGA
jgi:hypothetical protein